MRNSAAQLEFGYSMGSRAGVFTCPAEVPFLPALAEAVVDGTLLGKVLSAPEDILKIAIYVPSQAAVEPLKLAFLERSPNGASYFPRIFVLGQFHALDVFAAFGLNMDDAGAALDLLEKALAVPPEVGPLQRQLELCGILLKAASALRSRHIDFGEPLFLGFSPRSAFAAAERMAALIDEVYSDGADLSSLERLGGGFGTGTEQLSFQLLREALGAWQGFKTKEGSLDPEERRNRLMAIQAEFIRQSSAPVIVAGSSGTVAATLGLMQAALSRSNSAVLLHGLDLDCSDAVWETLGAHPEHPQFALHQLLQRLGVPRRRVLPLANGGRPAATAAFLNEALRPASAQGDGHRCKPSPDRLPRLSIVEAGTVQEEAEVVALILRKSIETGKRTAALITHDEALIRRVRHGLVRWGLPAPEADEIEAGLPLALRAAQCAATADIGEFVALLRAACGASRSEALRVAEVIDLAVLRQMWRPASLSGLVDAIAKAEHAAASGEARHPAMRRMRAAEWNAVREFASGAIRALSPLAERSLRRDLGAWAVAHREAIRGLAEFGVVDAGAAEGRLFEELVAAAPRTLTVDVSAYAGLFADLSARHARRPEPAPHPRIALRRPLDARFLTADVVILGGLNEGSWPRAQAFDPWLGRREREFAGLAPLERRVGLAAHDFVMLAASADHVYLTRCRKVNGSLSKPSRWISRIKVLARAMGFADALDEEKTWLAWAKEAIAPKEVRPASRPAPRPPVEARPRTLSVTAIETWFANPYAIYARHILRLDPLRRADETADARDKGILYHSALHKFFQDFPAALPADPAGELIRRLDLAASELGFNLDNAPFWWPRFARFALWFAKTEAERRAGLAALRSECSGKLELAGPAGPFTVTARADRIDVFTNGDLCIYDFKTSSNAAKASKARGAPQLALEGVLARNGAFGADLSWREVELRYIVATGGEPPGEMLPLDAPNEVMEAAHTGLVARIARFDDPEIPYAYEARPIFQDRSEYDPYAHLARVGEWASPAAERDDG